MNLSLLRASAMRIRYSIEKTTTTNISSRRSRAVIHPGRSGIASTTMEATLTTISSATSTRKNNAPVTLSVDAK